MQDPRQPRGTAAEFSKPVHQQLNRYALAATAAGVGILALAVPAEAKVVYTPTDVVIQGSVPLDLDHNGVIDFYLWHAMSNNGSTVASFLAIYPNPAGCGAIGTAIGAFKDAVAMTRGGHIQNGRRFNGNIGDMAVHGKKPGSISSTYWKGEWGNEGKGLKFRFLGLKFKIGKETHFGWARVSVLTTPLGFPFKVKLNGYAYETTPNMGIIAGDTGSGSKAKISDTSLNNSQRAATLGVLASGAAGRKN